MIFLMKYILIHYQIIRNFKENFLVIVDILVLVIKNDVRMVFLSRMLNTDGIS